MLHKQRTSVAFLLKDERLRNQSDMCYHYIWELQCSNRGQFCSITPKIMDCTQLEQKKDLRSFTAYRRTFAQHFRYVLSLHLATPILKSWPTSFYNA